MAPPVRYLPHCPLPEVPYIPGLGRGRPDLPSGSLLSADGAASAGYSPSLFAYATDCYNAGYYWEAHECWEVLWRRERRGFRRWFYLKGLILLAAAGVKVAQGRPAGAATLRRRATETLARGSGAATIGDGLPGFDPGPLMVGEGPGAAKIGAAFIALELALPQGSE